MSLVVLFVVSCLVLAGYSYLRYGKVRNWTHWRTALIGIIAVLCLIGLARVAVADPFEYTEIYAGLEYPLTSKASPQCVPGDSQTISNIGVNQHLFDFYNTHVLATYRHHSCAVGNDWIVTDHVGVIGVWRYEW